MFMLKESFYFMTSNQIKINTYIGVLFFYLKNFFASCNVGLVNSQSYMHASEKRAYYLILISVDIKGLSCWI